MSQSLTREEFGLVRFECIRTIGGMHQLLTQLALPDKSDEICRGWQQELDAATARLPLLLAQLPEEELREIQEAYTWIMDL